MASDSKPSVDDGRTIQARTATDADLELVRRARSGDPGAREALARRYRHSTYILALHLVGNPDVALDLTQEALLRFSTTLDRFDPRRAIKPWLYRIVSNLAVELLRQSPDRHAPSERFKGVERRSEDLEDPWFRAGAANLEARIDALYEEIADLTSHGNGANADPVLEEKLASSWAELRRLQQEEADRFRSAFEASLAMPIDAGAKILDEIRALRRELEDPAPSDAST